jgi:hypothetical protein
MDAYVPCFFFFFFFKKMRVSIARKEPAEGDIPPTTALRSIVSTKDAGVIIGKSGKNVSEIREQSGAKVTISEMVPGAYERILTVSGPLDTVAKVMNVALLLHTKHDLCNHASPRHPHCASIDMVISIDRHTRWLRKRSLLNTWNLMPLLKVSRLRSVFWSLTTAWDL